MIKRLGRAQGRTPALGWIFLALLICSPALGAGKGSMEIGLSAHYTWPGQDVAELGPAPDYGVVFHYWLTRTTSVMVGLEMMSFECPLEVDGRDEELMFNVTMLELGVRYRPEVDFMLKPYAEAAVGYELWSTDPGPGFIDPRSGGSLTYLLGLGFEQEFMHQWTWGVNVRYHYLPLQENLEREVVTGAGGSYRIEKVPIREVGFLSAGFDLTWRFR